MNSPISIESGHRFWFAVYTVPRHEKQVYHHLQMKEVESFLPLYSAVHHWRTGPARVELPLFPNYLFVHITNSERRRVLELTGVRGIVGSRSTPVPLPDSEIACLRQSLEAGWIEPHPYLRVGMQVRIVRGPLAGIEGLLVRQKSVMKVVLSIDLIGKSIAVEVSRAELEPVPPHKLRDAFAAPPEETNADAKKINISSKS